MFPAFAEGVRTAGTLHSLTGDGVHMSPEGNLLMARLILQTLGCTEAELDKAHQAWLDIPHAGAFDARRDVVRNRWLFRVTCDLTLRQREQVLEAVKTAGKPDLQHWANDLLATLMKEKIKPAGTYQSLEAIFENEQDKIVQEQLQKEFVGAVRVILEEVNKR